MKHLRIICTILMPIITFGMNTDHSLTIFEHYLIPQEIKKKIIQLAHPHLKNIDTILYPLPHHCNYYYFTPPTTFEYYNHPSTIKQYPPATLNTVELVSHDKSCCEGCQPVVSESTCPVSFRVEGSAMIDPTGYMQCGSNSLYQVRIGLRDSLDAQDLTHQIQHNYPNAFISTNDSFLFDGANKNSWCVVFWNYTICIYSIKVGDSKNGSILCRTHEASPYIIEKCEAYKPTFLMLDSHEDRIVMITRNMNSRGRKQRSLIIKDLIKDEINKLKLHTILEQPLPYPLTYMGRLSDWTYLGLSNRGQFISIAINNDTSITAQPKTIIYKDNNNIVKEDRFKLLAVDNCMGTYGKPTVAQHAANFVTINKEGMLFWGSFHKHFYNDKGQITLRKVNNENYSQAEKIWLNNDEIGILVKYPQVKKVVKHKVHCFELPAIEDKKSQNK